MITLDLPHSILVAFLCFAPALAAAAVVHALIPSRATATLIRAGGLLGALLVFCTGAPLLGIPILALVVRPPKAASAHKVGVAAVRGALATSTLVFGCLGLMRTRSAARAVPVPRPTIPTVVSGGDSPSAAHVPPALHNRPTGHGPKEPPP